MNFKKELLLSKQGIREFLDANKSELKIIAAELNVGYSTLRNYAYGNTPLDSMPYRLVEGLTRYVAPENLFKPERGIYLQEPAFYALATLAGREITPTPRAFAIAEYTKAVLLLKKREEQASDGEVFEPRYFFVDLKYQDGFLHEYNKCFTEREHQLYLQTTEQLKTMYGWSDSDLHDIVSQNNSTFELRTTDPEKAHKLFSLGLPRTGNENLWLLLQGKHNIHLIVTNKVVTDGRVSTHVINEIDNTFSVIEHQSKYYFNGVSWMEQPDNLVHQKAVSHLKGAEFNELRSHLDEPTYELVCRNLIELYTEKPNSDIWLKIANRMLHEQWTRHHNLDIQDGSFAALLEDEHVANSPALAKTFDNIAMELANNISKELKSLNQS